MSNAFLSISQQANAIHSPNYSLDGTNPTSFSLMAHNSRAITSSSALLEGFVS